MTHLLCLFLAIFLFHNFRSESLRLLTGKDVKNFGTCDQNPSLEDCSKMSRNTCRKMSFIGLVTIEHITTDSQDMNSIQITIGARETYQLGHVYENVTEVKFKLQNEASLCKIKIYARSKASPEESIERLTNKHLKNFRYCNGTVVKKHGSIITNENKYPFEKEGLCMKFIKGECVGINLNNFFSITDVVVVTDRSDIYQNHLVRMVFSEIDQNTEDQQIKSRTSSEDIYEKINLIELLMKEDISLCFIKTYGYHYEESFRLLTKEDLRIFAYCNKVPYPGVDKFPLERDEDCKRMSSDTCVVIVLKKYYTIEHITTGSKDINQTQIEIQEKIFQPGFVFRNVSAFRIRVQRETTLCRIKVYARLRGSIIRLTKKYLENFRYCDGSVVNKDGYNILDEDKYPLERDGTCRIFYKGECVRINLNNFFSITDVVVVTDRSDIHHDNLVSMVFYEIDRNTGNEQVKSRTPGKDIYEKINSIKLQMKENIPLCCIHIYGYLNKDQGSVSTATTVGAHKAATTTKIKTTTTTSDGTTTIPFTTIYTNTRAPTIHTNTRAPTILGKILSIITGMNKLFLVLPILGAIVTLLIIVLRLRQKLAATFDSTNSNSSIGSLMKKINKGNESDADLMTFIKNEIIEQELRDNRSNFDLGNQEKMIDAEVIEETKVIPPGFIQIQNKKKTIDDAGNEKKKSKFKSVKESNKSIKIGNDNIRKTKKSSKEELKEDLNFLKSETKLKSKMTFEKKEDEIKNENEDKVDIQNKNEGKELNEENLNEIPKKELDIQNKNLKSEANVQKKDENIKKDQKKQKKNKKTKDKKGGGKGKKAKEKGQTPKNKK